MLQVYDVRDKRELDWIDQFLTEVTKDPQVIKVKKDDFEKAVARTIKALKLGRNLKFAAAISTLRQEIYAYGSDAWNQRYYESLLLTVLEIFDMELAWAVHLYGRKQDLREWVDTRYVARSSGILEEARITEFMEDGDH